ncbi:putative DNA helicase [Hydrogenimonas sp.]|nr:putative DNA helicase [Hydrogenimonas sp.]
MKVAISSDFFTALSKLPRTQMNKTIRLVEKFKNNPTSPGLNYEKLQLGNDSQIYSLRVDNAYRVILFKPQKGDVYILLWVDHHDEAYKWARNHQCTIHPETGSLQIIQVTHETKSYSEKEQKRESFFSHFRDRELLRLGVPENMLPDIKRVDSEEELDALQGQLPEEAYEALFYLLAGDSYEEVLRYLAFDRVKPNIDIEDYAKALENANSRRRFYVVDENDVDLISMLNAPLEKWRVFLHPTQRAIVYRDWNGPVRVLGGAGTGKTVVAMHRAKWLAAGQSGNGKILFTTFTKNLAMDIYENLKTICSEKELDRIEVKNLDQWVYEFLYKNGYRDRIAYGDETAELWEEALTVVPADLTFPESFYKEEWEHVIQPQSVMTLGDYLRASRAGRGTRLSRGQRKMVWKVMEEYRSLLQKHHLKEPQDAMRDAKVLIEAGHLDRYYDAIVVDEAQDFSMQALQLLRSMVPETKNDLFIVGDAHQRIYGHKVVLGQCGIKIVGRSRKLKLNYRTTDEIRKWAVHIFEGEEVDDLDNGIDRQNDYKSLYHGPEPEVRKAETYSDELHLICEHVENLWKHEESASTCLVLRTIKLRDQYAKELKKMGIPIIILAKDTKDNLDEKGLRVATMHRVKGLDFDHMIIASTVKGIIPYEKTLETTDAASREESLQKERALLFVAATRAKKTLLITGFGEMSEWVDNA